MDIRIAKRLTIMWKASFHGSTPLMFCIIADSERLVNPPYGVF